MASLFVKIGVLPPLLLILLVFFSIANPIFASSSNLMSVSEQSVYLLLITLGQMVVLISGGFDLSVGATVALTSILSANVMATMQGGDAGTYGILLGFFTALVVGVVVGGMNGFGVAFLRVNPFIVTLATSSIIGGVTLVVSGGQQISGLPKAYVYQVGSGLWRGIPMPVLLILPALIIVAILLWRTALGRHIFAIGSNLAAAEVAGIRVRLTTVLTYVLCATLTSYAGWLLTARVASGQPLLGGAFTLQSIAAALIGGASLKGGRGSVGGAVLGVAFIMLLTNGMNLMRLDTNSQDIAVGVALIFAVVADQLRGRFRVRLQASDKRRAAPEA